MKIEELGLSPRARNALRRADITTVEDLRAYHAETLFAIRGVGVVVYSEIMKKLEAQGIRLQSREEAGR